VTVCSGDARVTLNSWTNLLREDARGNARNKVDAVPGRKMFVSRAVLGCHAGDVERRKIQTERYAFEMKRRLCPKRRSGGKLLATGL